MSHDWDVFLPASIEPVDWLDDLRDDAQVYNSPQSSLQPTLRLARVAHQARGNEASAGANGLHYMEPRPYTEVQVQVPPPATLCEGWCLKRWHEAEARHAGTLGRSLLNVPNVSSSVPVNSGNSTGLHSMTSIANNSRTVLCAITEQDRLHSEDTTVHWPSSIVAADVASNDPSLSYTANGDITALANTTMLRARHMLASAVLPQFPRPCGSVLVNSTASLWSSIVPAAGITTVDQQQPANAGLQPWAAMQALKKSSAGSTPEVCGVSETPHAATAQACTPPAAKGAKKSKHMRCRNCGTRNTPQWRCGPDGPRTLCNACGMRHKKGLPMVDRVLTKVGTMQHALRRPTQEANDRARMISGIGNDAATQPRKAAIWQISNENASR